VILLISSAFLARYDEKQMEKVADRHRKKAWISPILVRDSDWEGHKFMETLKDAILPEDQVAISISNKGEDEAYKKISRCLEKALDYLAS
ncbi:MAG TPA: hypothetical protein VEL70_03850, partial [Candidatus Acidoferrum sp.]|nr:hypothetical protein [Candidatus Acidoferrum sp.]